jgi:hypothetical protein
MYSDYFTQLDLPTDIVSEITDFIESNSDNFFISKLSQNRLDFNSRLIIKLSELIPFSISDGGVFKNSPGWNYSIHKDKDRQCALNMLLTDNIDDFEAMVYNDNRVPIKIIPYVKNQWLLLNTKKFHSVKNNSLTETRYNISIGRTIQDYYKVKDKLLNHQFQNEST